MARVWEDPRPDREPKGPEWDAWFQRTMNAAPPMTDEMAERIAAILRGARARARDES